MSREIKFRAWDKENNVMWFTGMGGAGVGDYTFHEFFNPSTHALEAVVVKSVDVGFVQTMDTEYQLPIMQYTGLKDKHGKEIYEGDIVKIGLNIIAKIIWSNEKAAFAATDDKIQSEHLFGANLCEIIGNIWENPELKGGVSEDE